MLDEAERHVGPSDERARARLLLARLGMRQWGPDPGEQVQALAEVRQAMSTLEEAGDHEGLAYAHLVAYHASERLSTVRAERELALAVEHARAAGARGIEGVATSWLCVHVRHGPLPVDEAKERMLRILDDPPSRYARASALGGLVDLRAMEGAFDEARALVAENHSIIEGSACRRPPLRI